MWAYLRKQRAKCRDYRKTVYIADLEGFDPVGSSNPEQIIQSWERLTNLRLMLEGETDWRIKEAMLGWLEDETKGGVARRLVSKGLCGNENSARVTVCRLLKQGKFDHYRAVLTA